MVGLLEEPTVTGDSARERASFVAEELGREQVATQRGDVDRHEGGVRAPGGEVQRARDELLAAASLPANEHGGGRAGVAEHLGAEVAHRGGVSDHADRREDPEGDGGHPLLRVERLGRRRTVRREGSIEAHREESFVSGWE